MEPATDFAENALHKKYEQTTISRALTTTTTLIMTGMYVRAFDPPDSATFRTPAREEFVPITVGTVVGSVVDIFEVMVEGKRLGLPDGTTDAPTLGATVPDKDDD